MNSEREKNIAVSLPAPLVEKVVSIASADMLDGQLSEYVANLLREAVATRETQETTGTQRSFDQELKEIRARLKKLGYLSGAKAMTSQRRTSSG